MIPLFSSAAGPPEPDLRPRTASQIGQNGEIPFNSLSPESAMSLPNHHSRREFCKHVSAGALAAAGAAIPSGVFGTITPPTKLVPNLGIGADLNGAVPFPSNNPWNQDISKLPVDKYSAQLIASIGLTTGLHPDFGSAPANGIPYIVVPGTQAPVQIAFTAYGDESDPGPYPIPPNAPIEGDTDQHVLVVDRDHWLLYEMFLASKVAGTSNWKAACGAKFDLNSNALRPEFWTSADAAGLPIFPGLVRYDEVVTHGAIHHALRFTASKTRKAFVWPARHWASSNTSVYTPSMGMRVRLKASYDISKFPAEVQVILTALKKYGMFLADNGSNWYISGAPDPRWNDANLHALSSVHGSNFEVVQMGQIVTPAKPK
jgi:hypothetical protein